MTIKKAISVLRSLLIFDSDCDEDCEALEMAIRALENIRNIQANVYILNKFIEEIEKEEE